MIFFIGQLGSYSRPKVYHMLKEQEPVLSIWQNFKKPETFSLEMHLRDLSQKFAHRR